MQACRLTATDLACRRGERVLFKGLSRALQGGEACQLAGANGIGKSSLIRILAGLLRPYAGSVEREGALALADERPALDGHLLNFVNAPNRYGLPAFYEIHVWAWEHNPVGSFADWNTHVSCDRQPSV